MALKPIHYVGIGVGVLGAIAIYSVVAKASADKASLFAKPWTASIEARLQPYFTSVTSQDVADAAESPLGVFQGSKGFAYATAPAGLSKNDVLAMKDLLPMLAERGLVLHVDAKYKDTTVALGTPVAFWITKLGDAAPVDGFIVLR